MHELQYVQEEEQLLKNKIIKCIKSSNKKMHDITIVIKKTKGISVTVRQGVLEYVEFNNDGICYITVYNNKSKGSASSTDCSFKSMQQTLKLAMQISDYTDSDVYAGLPELKYFLPDYINNLNLLYPGEFNVKKIYEIALLTENSAFQFDKRIVNTEGVTFNSHISNIVYGNSLGIFKGYSSSYHTLSCCSIAKEKHDMQRDFSYTTARQLENLESPILIGTESARRSIDRLFPKKIKTMKSAVIFFSEIASSFFNNLVYAINGNNVYKKSTFLLDALGCTIFPKWLNIIDNPHLDQGLGSKYFDNEGVCTKNNVIIENGILKTWLLNSYTARQLNFDSTGHAGGIHNWLITGDGNLNFEELMKYMDKGLLVTELMGQGVNITTGDYSRGVFGFWIENGTIQYPVSEITISGNLKDMFKNIIKIGNDINKKDIIHCGSILLSEMQISGI
ncbi:MAG TPA: metalloprotease PmbA [Buchnera sp. (in: enterobacteria)]|nr:metalloprotease PmbA [Buchnera sp. (in: enterobacteria)]